MRRQLTDKLIDSLGLPSCKTPSDQVRMIYSAVGRSVFATIWEFLDKNDFISIAHFKQQILQIAGEFREIYPAANALFPNQTQSLATSVYEIYKQNGFFHHWERRITPIRLTQCTYANTTLYRGIPLLEKLNMSGLGLYSTAAEMRQKDDIFTFFDIPRQDLNSVYKTLVDLPGNWSVLPNDIHPDFLNLDLQNKRGYWTNKLVKPNQFSLLRYGEQPHVYALYYVEESTVYVKHLPSWMYTDFRTTATTDYFRIAAALMAQSHLLPAILVDRGEHLSRIHCSLRLPAEELSFFQLFSWPSSFLTPDSANFTRIIHNDVYSVFKSILSNNGFVILERDNDDWNQ